MWMKINFFFPSSPTFSVSSLETEVENGSLEPRDTGHKVPSRWSAWVDYDLVLMASLHRSVKPERAL